MKIKPKTLISISTCESPYFLSHLMDSIERYDPGVSYDLVIVDNGSINSEKLKLLEKLSKNWNIEQKENTGRAQGGYNYAWQHHKGYEYYFFLHDDSSIIQPNWLKTAIDRINDNSLESVLPKELSKLPVGKVGFQTYEWQNTEKYLRTGYRALMYYCEALAKVVGFDMPKYHQHINDDRILYRGELLEKNNGIWNLENARKMEEENPKLFNEIYDFFDARGMCNTIPFANNNYPIKYHPFEIVVELLSDTIPMRHGYRSHHITGNGNCQEELGWSRFWGNEYIVHYGDHVVFKRLAHLLKANENEVRKRFKDKTFLKICDNIIKKEVYK